MTDKQKQDEARLRSNVNFGRVADHFQSQRARRPDWTRSDNTFVLENDGIWDATTNERIISIRQEEEMY